MTWGGNEGLGVETRLFKSLARSIKRLLARVHQCVSKVYLRIKPCLDFKQSILLDGLCLLTSY